MSEWLMWSTVNTFFRGSIPLGTLTTLFLITVCLEFNSKLYRPLNSD